MNKLIIKKREKRNYEQFTTRIEEELLNEIRNLVKENNLESVNSFINECIRFALDNIEIKHK